MKPFFQSILLAAFLLCQAQSARADEFSAVPMGDTAYKQLAALAPTGWIELHAAPRTPLTRYEIATEAARALVSLRARRDAGQTFVVNAVSRAALSALRELSGKFRAELRAMGIDSNDAMRLCDDLMRETPMRRAVIAAPLPETSSEARPVRAATAGELPRRVALSLSDRLQFESLVSKLERDAVDPFGDTGVAALPNAARAGVALAVNPTVALHAFGGHTLMPSRELALLPVPSSMRIATRGGGVSVSLPRGVQLRGEFEKLSALDNGESGAWNRFGAELGFAAWQNRLSLRANWSRLLPNDARLLPSTTSGLDMALDISERLRLTLLYRQMYGERAEATANRVVSGGININF
jgi:hypothetical protein